MQYGKIMSRFFRCLEESKKLSLAASSAFLEKEVAEVNKKTLSSSLQEAARAVREGKEALSELVRDVEVAKKKRAEAQKKLEEAETDLIALQVKHFIYPLILPSFLFIICL